MDFRSTPEMKKKAIELFQCDKDPLNYLIRSTGDVVEVESKKNIVATLFESKKQS